MENLCADVILGSEFGELHESVTCKYGGTLPPLEVCGLSTLNVDPVEPFSNLPKDTKPIATKSRKYSKQGLEEVLLLLILRANVK